MLTWRITAITALCVINTSFNEPNVQVYNVYGALLELFPGPGGYGPVCDEYSNIFGYSNIYAQIFYIRIRILIFIIPHIFGIHIRLKFKNEYICIFGICMANIRISKYANIIKYS